MISYPTIDPVAFYLGPLKIHWYGLSYMAGLLLGWKWVCWVCRRFRVSFSPQGHANSVKIFSDYIPYAALGIVLGGRLGHAIFYQLPYYSEKPWEVFYIWQPGMSFHGGLIGVLLVTLWYIKRYHLNWKIFLDLVALATPLGLLCGRLANFINAELVGRVTTVPWAMIFPHDSQPRHPSQLYEAALEGIALFGILSILYIKGWSRKHPGTTAGLFACLYSMARIFVECYREPDGHIGYILSYFTLGQLYSLPLFMAGVYVLWRARCTP